MNKVRAREAASKPTPRRKPSAKSPVGMQSDPALEAKPKDTLIPYDEHLLERARTQWQFGDWSSLTQLNGDTLKYHPDRDKLALLAAAGRLQTGQDVEAREYIRLARDWGVSDTLIGQILIAGVHHSLGRAAAIGTQPHRALQHFEQAITIGTPGADAKLIAQARVNGKVPSSDGSGSQDTDRKHSQLSPDVPRHAGTASLSERVQACLDSQDIYEAIDQLMESNRLSPHDQILFYLETSDQFVKRNDKLTALHFLQTARNLLPQNDDALKALLIQKLVAIGQPDLAADLAFQAALRVNGLHLSDASRNAIQISYEKSRKASMAKAEHGHNLLLSYMKAHIKDIKPAGKRRPILIEIGTTREDVPGQGSTRQLADFCRQHRVHFITVDMDPHNTHVAAAMFAAMGVKFEAITMKGEEYLAGYPGPFDVVFLDAYDFDHGGHSELRQSRYRKYLGSPIDEVACHQMHLDCAKSVVSKLAINGVVCLDDTWLVDGKWTAKGTTAMPYLLDHGFTLLEARNRAALLKRDREKPCAE